jgi:membrane protein
MDPQRSLNLVDGSDTTPPEHGHEEKDTLVDRARSRVTDTWSRVEEARPRIPVLDAAFDVRAYDQEVAGGLPAGAIAFRLFLWFVPFALVVVMTLGWVVDDTSMSQAELANTYGITGVVSTYVGDAAGQSSTGRVLILLAALYALYLASVGAVRAIRVAHVLAWRMPRTKVKGSLRAALWFVGGTTLVGLVTAAVNAIRQSLPGPGLVLLLLMVVFVGAVWLAASWKLPHPPEVPLTALVPGAILVAMGAEVLHVVTVLWYAHKIEHSSELYGSLGIAVGLLAWLYLLGRLAIASAVLNATLWRRKNGPPRA